MNSHGSAHPLDRLLDDGEPDAGLRSLRRRERFKNLEYFRLVLRRDADAAVRDAEPKLVLAHLAIHAHAQWLAGLHEANRVLQQIRNALGERRAVRPGPAER